MSSDELARRDHLQGLADFDLGLAHDPDAVLLEAHRAARALKRVIDAKPNKVMMNDEVYLEFEDWQTVGAFYGIAPRVTETRFVTYGDAQGWEAFAEAVHIQTDRMRSRAEGMCLNDEEKWRARSKYEYHYVRKSGGTSKDDPGRDELIWEAVGTKRRPKKVRIQMADEPVPMFQLRSMAQTRAMAKAMRGALAWVVVLAGYKPTPAEELDIPTPSPGIIEHAPPSLSGEEPPLLGGTVGLPAPDADDRLALLTEISTLANALGLMRGAYKRAPFYEAWDQFVTAHTLPHGKWTDAAPPDALRGFVEHLRNLLAENSPPAGEAA